MPIFLNAPEVRVLGALVEKEITTPEYYPLSLNALINACNQKSSRDPVMELDEAAVRDALQSLSERGLAGEARSSGRVAKYEHRLQEVYNFYRSEIAVLCLLMLRGPQTPGELRGRAERLHRFTDLDEVQGALQRLMKREPPLAIMLPRQSGTKEARYAHLLSGEQESWKADHSAPHAAASGDGIHDRVASLEQQVLELRNELGEIKQRLQVNADKP